MESLAIIILCAIWGVRCNMSKMDIIIPAYRAEQTINRTLASIYMQTFKDEICIYIVGDCDGVDYRNNLFRDLLNVTYLSTKKNVGAGGTRQVGINNSSSDYFMFMDSDDCLASAFSCELLYRNAILNNADMVAGSFDNDIRDNNTVSIGEDNGSLTWLHGRIFKRSFIDEHKICFREDLRTNEDCYFNQLFFSYEPNAINMHKVCYSWLWTDGSLTRSGKTDNRFWVLYDYIQAAEAYIDEVCMRKMTNKPVVLKMIADDLMITYRYYNEILDTYSTDYGDKYLQRCKEYYANALSKVPQALDDELLTTSNMNVLKNVEFTSRIPSVSIPQFAKMIMGV